MRCRIPFIHNAVVIDKGGRRMYPELFGAWAEADIPELSSSEAPESIVWEYRRLGTRRASRWHDGSNWRTMDTDCAPKCDGDLFPLLTGSRNVGRIANFARATFQAWNHLQSFIECQRSRNRWFTVMDPADYREILYHDKAEAEARTVDLAERNLVLVDGSVWTRGGEPFYCLFEGNGRPHSSVVTDINNHLSSLDTAYFSAGADREMTEYSIERFGSPPEMDCILEVLIPEAVTFDGETESLMFAVREAVDKGAEHLRNKPGEFVSAWLRLRDAVEPGPAHTDEVASLLSIFMEECPPGTNLRKIAEKALERHVMSPIDIHTFGAL